MDGKTNLGDLPAAWRARARLLREYGGDPPVAKVWDVAAVELEQALRTYRDEALNLTEAAKVSGHTADHLGELVRTGKIPNAGRKNAPLIRRADLPIKGPTPTLVRPLSSSQQDKRQKAVERAANAIHGGVTE